MPGNFNWPGMAPGVSALVQANFKALFLSHTEQFLAQGRYIAGDASRDPTNTTDVTVLQPGTIMGKIGTVVNSLGTVGFYAPSILGLTSLALATGGTTLTVPAAVATEIARRCGATGSITITGAPAASGVVRTLTVPYSAVGATTLTITAQGGNAVQTLNFANSPSGTFSLDVVDLNGVLQSTGPITYSATIATLLTNINAGLVLALGAAIAIATGTAVTAVAVTFSGVGYAGLPQPQIIVDDGALTAGTISVTQTTAGGSGAFVTGSIIGPTDGSQIPLTFIDDWTPGISTQNYLGANLTQVDFGRFPIAGVIDTGQIINYPADPSARLWLETQMSTLIGGKFIFAGVNGPF
jgi:hypothetical protein